MTWPKKIDLSRTCHNTTTQPDLYQFDAEIKKGGPGVGFGMIIEEHPKTRHVIVKDVLPAMIVVQLPAAADSAVMEGDRLLAIDTEDTRYKPSSTRSLIP